MYLFFFFRFSEHNSFPQEFDFEHLSVQIILPKSFFSFSSCAEGVQVIFIRRACVGFHPSSTFLFAAAYQM